MLIKLAIVVNSFPEVSETFIINKVLFLAKNGFRVDVIKLGQGGNKQLINLYQFDKQKNIQIVNANMPGTVKQFLAYAIAHPIVFIKNFSINKSTFYKNLKQQILQVQLQKKQYQIVHFEFSGIACQYINLIQNIKAKTVVSCRGSAEKVKPLSEPDRKDKLKQLFSVVNAIHCVSNDMKNTILPYCNSATNIFINRPAIDVAFFNPNFNNPKSNTINIITIGRMTFQKGYLIGLLAIKKLVLKGHNFIWQIVGDGQQLEELIFHIHSLQLQNYVQLLGKKNKEDVNNLLANAHIFILTSVYEGIPNVVLEAMAMQLPVVSTNCGGVDEVIDNGVDGFISPLYDIENVANNIEKLFFDASLRKQIGINAREKILKHYSLQRQVDVFKNEYAKLIN